MKKFSTKICLALVGNLLLASYSLASPPQISIGDKCTNGGKVFQVGYNENLPVGFQDSEGFQIIALYQGGQGFACSGSHPVDSTWSELDNCVDLAAKMAGKVASAPPITSKLKVTTNYFSQKGTISFAIDDTIYPCAPQTDMGGN